MERIKTFIKTALIGGIGVILPVIILVMVFSWLFNFVTGNIQPLTNLIFADPASMGIFADIISIIIIIIACFLLGLIVRTKLGQYIHNSIEKILLKKIPGYNIAKDTVEQFIGREEMPFSSVVLVKIFDNGTLATGFITDKHSNGSYTVFVPTGPNPTSGNILHVNSENVFKVDIPLEHAMKSIIACGAGSNKLVEKYINLQND
ncbi:MAG: DUF502 domain-containing protein [Halobacteriota archaeon]